jgi:Protein of unknown function (DUF1194)
MAQPLRFAAACAAAVLAWLPAARAEHAVDANLVTALDASDSMMRHEEWVLLDGMARAVVHPAFLAAVRAGRHRRVGFAAFAWSSHRDLRVVVPWAVLGSQADAERIAHALARAPRRGDTAFGGDQDRSEAQPSPDRMTDVSEALRYGLDLLAAAPHGAARPVLNVCGNGVDNVGEGPERARGLALGAGVTVNGLVVGDKPGLAAYYRERVAAGPGSFVVEAREPADVADATLRKLLLDLLSSADTRAGRRMALAGGDGTGPPMRHGR